MTVVADSGPLIHLAVARQFFLLKRFFDKTIIIPQVYDEVVTQGKGKPGDSELCQALGEGWVVVESVTELRGVRMPNLSGGFKASRRGTIGATLTPNLKCPGQLPA